MELSPGWLVSQALAGGMFEDRPVAKSLPGPALPADRGFDHLMKYRPRKNERKRKRKQQTIARRANRTN